MTAQARQTAPCVLWVTTVWRTLRLSRSSSVPQASTVQWEPAILTSTLVPKEHITQPMPATQSAIVSPVLLGSTVKVRMICLKIGILNAIKNCSYFRQQIKEFASNELLLMLAIQKSLLWVNL